MSKAKELTEEQLKGIRKRVVPTVARSRQELP
jgi:hypothetical protein